MRVKFIATLVMSLMGLMLLLPYPNIDSDRFLLGWNLCAPFAYFIVDRLFKYISMNVYDRDFILWLRYSDEIDDSLTGVNQHVGMLDILLSLLSLALAFGLTIFGVTLARGIL